MTGKYRLSEQVEAELVKRAWDARKQSHSPYSKFSVGAALLTESGEIVLGCNVESASFGAGVCAERNAVTTAVSQGHTNFTAIAVVAESPTPTPPCGICRQILAEFGADVDVVFANTAQVERRTLSELIPDLFDFSHLPTT